MASALESVLVFPTGDSLVWPSIDADVYALGLVEQCVRAPMVYLPTVTTVVQMRER